MVTLAVPSDNLFSQTSIIEGEEATVLSILGQIEAKILAGQAQEKLFQSQVLLRLEALQTTGDSILKAVTPLPAVRIVVTLGNPQPQPPKT